MVGNVASGLATLARRWQTNQSPKMVGRWLASQHCTADLMPMLRQYWKSDHKLTFSQNLWGMVGKGLASQNHNANLMPMLGQCWNSDHLLLFPKIGWQLVGNWSDTDVGPMLACQPIAILTV